MVQVVFLTGGLGTRLKPLTEKIPKGMIPVRGKPFLEHQLDYLKEFGFCRFLLLVGYLGSHFQNYFQDGKRFGFSIDYSFEETPLGTGGALKLAEKKLDEQFILVNGDTFYPLDYTHFLAQATKVKNGGMMTVYDNREEIAISNVKVELDGTISAYSRQGSPGEMNGVDGGVSFYHCEILQFIPRGRKVALEDEIYPLLIRKGLLRAFFTNIRYYDIGTFEGLETVKRILT